MQTISNIARQSFVKLIRVYQYALSGLFGACCRYYPTCSSYAIDAIKKYGVFHGGWMALKRMMRCHPWHQGGVDTVPERKDKQCQRGANGYR